MLDIEIYKAKAKELGLTQYRLARMCGVLPQQIHMYWSGKTNLGTIMEKRLQKALNIEIQIK